MTQDKRADRFAILNKSMWNRLRLYDLKTNAINSTISESWCSHCPISSSPASVWQLINN